MRGAASGVGTAASVFDGGFSVAFAVAGADAAAAAFAGGTSLPAVAGAAAGLVAGVFRSAAFFFNVSSASTFFSTKLLMTSKGDSAAAADCAERTQTAKAARRGKTASRRLPLFRYRRFVEGCRAGVEAAEDHLLNAEGAALVASCTLATAIRAARSAGKP